MHYPHLSEGPGSSSSDSLHKMWVLSRETETLNLVAGKSATVSFWATS